MLKDGIKIEKSIKNMISKNNLSQLGLASKTYDLNHKTRITSHKTNQDKS